MDEPVDDVTTLKYLIFYPIILQSLSAHALVSIIKHFIFCCEMDQIFKLQANELCLIINIIYIFRTDIVDGIKFETEICMN